MTEYLIAFNDEWVAEHTPEQLQAKAESAGAVVAEMRSAGVLIFTNGGLDRSTAVCSVEAVDGKPLFTDGPYVETKEHLGGFAVVDVADDDAARYWPDASPSPWSGRRRCTGSGVVVRGRRSGSRHARCERRRFGSRA